MLLREISFPPADQYKPAQWAPIYIEPIAGSGERLLVGVAAVSKEGVAVKRAHLKKLDCLFGESAIALMHICEIALLSIEDDLKKRGGAALLEPRPGVSGVHVAPPLNAMALSVDALADQWLHSLSSLSRGVQAPNSEEEGIDVGSEGVSDSSISLPRLVHDVVVARAPSLERYFRPELRPSARRERRPRRRAFDVRVDYSGGRVVANMATLLSTQPTRLVSGLKQKLWDLDAFRGRRVTPGVLSFPDARGHELLLLRPTSLSGVEAEILVPQMEEMLAALIDQADPLEIRVRPFSTIDVMASHILTVEGPQVNL